MLGAVDHRQRTAAMPDTGPSIVVVDDESAILDLIVTQLQRAGYRTNTARDGVEALAVISATSPRGVVLDVGMPNMDGFGVLRALRNDPKMAATPVLVLTARNAVDDVQKAMALGARDFMTKPFDGPRLMARVARLVRPRMDGARRMGAY